MATLAGLSFGRYRVRARRGQGGMGEVYLGSALGPDGVEKPVALKTVRALHRQRQELVQMFLDEAKVSFLLTHPNIVQTYELGAVDDHHFLVMEWVEGITLEQLLGYFRDDLRRPVPAALALYVAMQIARALDYAHSFVDAQGRPLRIVHRDVSPSNVLLSRDGQVKVTDFGLVKSVLSKVETEVGQIKGKAAYMAPEQLASGPADARTDIYALGVILHEMLGGEHPFGARGEVTLHARLLGSAIRPLSERAPDLPPAVLELVAGCVAAAPADRFASAGELGRRIDRCMREAGWRVSEYELSELVAQIGAAAASTPVAPHPFDLALGLELARVEGGAGGPAAFTSTPFNTVLERGPRDPAAPDARGAHVRPHAQPVRTSLAANAAPTRGAGPRRRRSVALIAAAILALLLGLGYLAAERRDTPPTGSPVAPGPSPTARVAAAQRELRHERLARADREPGAAAVARAATDRADGGGPSAQDQPAPVPRTQAASGAARRPLARPRAPRGRRLAEAVEPVPMGTLSVNSEPWAVVFVDDVRLRSTPLLGHSLAAGSHRVRLEHPPRQWTATREVVIRAGEETRLSVELGP